MAVDIDRNVWAIAKQSSKAVRITPMALPGPAWAWQVDSIAVGQGPYTYSDMTGFQLRNVASINPLGRWRHVFQGCSSATSFELLDVDATLPPGASLKLAGRVGASPAALQQAVWTPLATMPPDTSPIDLAAKIAQPAGDSLLEIEVQLQTADIHALPSLHGLSLRMNCLPTIQ
jgi:hypothetical protein